MTYSDAVLSKVHAGPESWKMLRIPSDSGGFR